MPDSRCRSSHSCAVAFSSAVIAGAERQAAIAEHPDQREIQRDVHQHRRHAHHHRRAALPERVERRRDDADDRVAEQAGGVEPQRGGGVGGVGRGEAAVLEDHPRRSARPARSGRASPARSAASSGRWRGRCVARTRSNSLRRPPAATPPAWRRSPPRRRTGRSAGTSAGTRSRATTPRRCPGPVASIVLTNTLICVAASPIVPGPISSSTRRSPSSCTSMRGR